MKFAVIILCSVVLQSTSLDCSFAQTTSADLIATNQAENDLPANESVKIESLEWKHSANDNQNTSAVITLTNLSNKKIKRIDFSVIANDQSGVALESEGFAIKNLKSTDEVAPYSRKTFTFEDAFRSDKVAELKLRNATVEYENGSIDIISNSN